MASAFSDTAICTLFEGNYHYGVAALTNSLYAHGYRGDIYAGYRGVLPEWTRDAKSNTTLLGRGGKTLTAADGLLLHFIPLDTDYHLTNYKPDFMIQLWDGPAKSASRMFYLDPDIVVSASWTFFNQWVECGVALCEDVNSPLPENHPRRAAWRQYYKKRGIALCFKTTTYANGGYVGLHKRNRGFLHVWQTIQEAMAPAIGGLNRCALNGGSLPPEAIGAFAPFSKTDQDALNAAMEAWDGELSLVGKEGMSITSGGSLLPHAIGHPKPWNWSPIKQALCGRPPRRADREYWKNTHGILVAHPLPVIRQKKVAIRIAAFIGRFYRRG